MTTSTSSKKTNFDVSERECYCVLFWIALLIGCASIGAVVAHKHSAQEVATLCIALIACTSVVLALFAIDHLRSPYIDGARCPIKLGVHYDLVAANEARK